MSFIDSYTNIVAYVESKINIISTLSESDAALVAAMANLLDGRNNPPSNMGALQAWLQSEENSITTASLVKDVTLLLGAAMPSKNTVWKKLEYTSGGTFVVPKNIVGGIVWLTGCGGGGSGSAAGFSTGNGGTITGGAGGFWVYKRPHILSNSTVVTVTIGQGGASVVKTSAGFDPGVAGGATAFDGFTIAGGQGGLRTGISSNTESCPLGGFLPGYFGFEANISLVTIDPGDYVVGNPSPSGACGNPSRVIASGRVLVATGGGAGYFGSGTNGNSSSDADVTAPSALPNTGAGGGSAGTIYPTSTPTKTVTSGAGGSGKLIVEWQEFV